MTKRRCGSSTTTRPCWPISRGSTACRPTRPRSRTSIRRTSGSTRLRRRSDDAEGIVTPSEAQRSRGVFSVANEIPPLRRTACGFGRDDGLARHDPRPRAPAGQCRADLGRRHRAGLPAVQRPARELHLGHGRGWPHDHRSGGDGADAQGNGPRRPAAGALCQVHRPHRGGRPRQVVPHPRAGDIPDRPAYLALDQADVRRHGLRDRGRRDAGLPRRAPTREPGRHRVDGRGDLGPVAVAVLVRPDADVPVRPDPALAAKLRLRRRWHPAPDPAGGRVGRRTDGAAGAHHPCRRARRAERRLRAHRPIQGHERAARRRMACAAQRIGAGDHHHRPAVRLADGPGGGGREAVRLAGRRLAADRFGVPARHAGGPGLHPADRAVLPRHQHAGRHRLCRDRPAHPVRPMTLMPLKLMPKLRGGTSLWIGGGLVALAVFVAVAAPLIARTDPVMDANLMNAEIPPGWEFPFGTDAQGRDIYSRIVYGARISLTVGIGSQILNSLIGVSLGLTAGYWGGWWDDFVTALTNLMLAIPSLIFALAIMAILGPGLSSLLMALGLTAWSYSCRIARAQVLSLKSQGYIQAARILGYGDLRIMFTQVLPNILGPLIVIATLGMGTAILSEAALSFLGLGIRPPFPSWGSMLSEARDQINTVPWLSIFPGVAIFLTVLGLNLLGDGLRDILDPQSTTRRS